MFEEYKREHGTIGCIALHAIGIPMIFVGVCALLVGHWLFEGNDPWMVQWLKKRI